MQNGIVMRSMAAHAKQALTFDELEVGDSWTSQARTITETDVVNFACLTGDFNPLHVDREHARRTPYKRRIAHGLLGLSFMAGLGSFSPFVETAAFVQILNWRFEKPIYIGDTVHVVNEVIEKRQNGRRRGHVIWRRRIINQRNEVVQEGELETLVMTSAARSLPPR
jgi:3-hydroxybutyryl-CoA dehydratase